MTGVVIGRHALLRVPVQAPGGRCVDVEFVLDTGFAGFLTLPSAAASVLELPYLYPIRAGLADGTAITVLVYEATVLWDGVQRQAEVLATGGEALLGTALLASCDVHIRFIDGGAVSIDPVQAPRD